MFMLQCHSNPGVNDPATYPVDITPNTVKCLIDGAIKTNDIDPLIYGTNLEWFNNAGGLIDSQGQLNVPLMNLASDQGIQLYRYPGGTLADYYHWQDGIGPLSSRKAIDHPTDTGQSVSLFGTPQFAQFLNTTNGQALITANAGTGTAAEAASWVDYANNPSNTQRIADGFVQPLNFKLWEIGNELYLPGNPTDVQNISVTPDVYASRFIAFANAMKAVDPTIKLLALGADHSGVGPSSHYPNWTEVVLKAAASQIDYIAVHNGYFPTLYTERQPAVSLVYPAMMAAPEAVDASLKNLESLIAQYENGHPINIAITEWGGFYSIPRADLYWVDHVKTQGTAIYVARMMQVFLSHPKVKITNYFKFVDQSFMGWVNYGGKPKVPYWSFELFARFMRGSVVNSSIDNSGTFSTPQVGGVPATSGVKELTSVAAVDHPNHKLHISLVNRSMSKNYVVNLQLLNFQASSNNGQLMTLSAPEITSNNGRDFPPGTPKYDTAYEPYSSVPADSIAIKTQAWDITKPVTVPPFSVMVVEVDGH